MDQPATGHSYFGLVSSAAEAHAVLEASRQGLLPRVTRRLTDEERIHFVRAGAVFVWEEEEAGIRRWTDHVKWSPSRVSGAFLTYSELPPRGDDTLIKQSFSSVDGGTKMHLIAYSSKNSLVSGMRTVSMDPVLRDIMSQRQEQRESARASTSTSVLSASGLAPAPSVSPGGPSSSLSTSPSGLTSYPFPASPHASSSTSPSLSDSPTSPFSFSPSKWSIPPDQPQPSSSFSSRPAIPPRTASFPPPTLPTLTAHLSAPYSRISPPPSFGASSFIPASPRSSASPSLPSLPQLSPAPQSHPLTDIFGRTLPPFHSLSARSPDPPPNPSLAPLRGSFVDEDDEDTREEVSRGAEDERQLRLLGRSI